jgi:aerobic carbon-monoxide dehydrogenase medium subunit
MIPRSFEYFAPRTLEEAVSLLGELGQEAKILSGGQSLIPMMKLRLATPPYIIDINRIPDLNYISELNGFLRIGALARESDFEVSPTIISRYPILMDTTVVIADPLVRNQATACGNLAHGDPANDHPATMLALGASIIAIGPRREREIPIESFFTSLFTTALQPDEILKEIRVPIPPPFSGGAYLKIKRKVGDYAAAGVAVQITLNGAGVCHRAGIGLTNVGFTPIKARETEAFLTGQALDDATIKRASEIAAGECHPIDEAEYKRDLVRVLTARAIKRAAHRAKGGA